MDKGRAKKLGEILLAYSRGETIQIQEIYKGFEDISDLNEILTRTDFYQLRVKPELKLVPFTFEDNKLFRDKWLRVKGGLPLTKITSFSYKGFDFYQGNDIITWEYALKHYEFEDGSPCGKYIEE